MTISIEIYEKELESFVSKWNSTFPDEQWRTGRKHTGLYAELKYFSESEQLWHHLFIIYSQSYGVPQLWFNLYQPGTLLKRIPLEDSVRSPESLARCSEEEHPFLGVAFYYVDPCRILQVLEKSKVSSKEDYLLK